MLFAKFGWTWTSGFWEKVDNVKSFETDSLDRRHKKISKNPSWAFSSGELKRILGTGHWNVRFLSCFQWKENIYLLLDEISEKKIDILLLDEIDQAIASHVLKCNVFVEFSEQRQP